MDILKNALSNLSSFGGPIDCFKYTCRETGYSIQYNDKYNIWYFYDKKNVKIPKIKIKYNSIQIDDTKFNTSYAAQTFYRLTSYIRLQKNKNSYVIKVDHKKLPKFAKLSGIFYEVKSEKFNYSLSKNNYYCFFKSM